MRLRAASLVLWFIVSVLGAERCEKDCGGVKPQCNGKLVACSVSIFVISGKDGKDPKEGCPFVSVLKLLNHCLGIRNKSERLPEQARVFSYSVRTRMSMILRKEKDRGLGRTGQ